MSLNADDFAKFDGLPDTAFVRVGTVARIYSVTPATIYRWSRKRMIPAPRRLGPQVTAWNVGELRIDLRKKAA